MERFFDRFESFSGCLLNPAEQLITLAFDVLKVFIRELRPFLFEFAFGDVPVALDFEFCHRRLSLSFSPVFPWASTSTAAGTASGFVDVPLDTSFTVRAGCDFPMG